MPPTPTQIRALADEEDRRAKTYADLIANRKYVQEMVAKGLIDQQQMLIAENAIQPSISAPDDNSRKLLDVFGPDGMAARYERLAHMAHKIESYKARRSNAIGSTSPNDPALNAPLPPYMVKLGFGNTKDLFDPLQRWSYKVGQRIWGNLSDLFATIGKAGGAVAQVTAGVAAFPIIESRKALGLGVEDIPTDFLNQVSSRRESFRPPTFTPDQQGEVTTTPPPPALGPDQTQLFLKGHAKMLDYMGIPADPIDRQAYENTYPLTATLVGEIAYMTALHFATGGSLLQKGADTGIGILARGGTAPTIKAFGKQALSRGTIGAGIGGLIGYNSSALQSAEDPEGLRQAMGVMRGAGAGFFMASLLWGKPLGAEASAIHMLERTGKLGGLGRLGAALRYSPRTTVGYMMESAILGTTMTTTQLATNGVPINEAIIGGLKDAPFWIFGDLALLKVAGGAARWGRTAKIFDAYLQDVVASIGLVPRVAAGAATGATAGGAAGAAVGVAFPETMDADSRLEGLAKGASKGVMMGAITGATVGMLGRFLFHDTVLPLKVKDKLRRQDWAALTPEEAGQVTRAIIRDTASRTASAVEDDAEAVLFLKQIKRDPPSDPAMAARHFQIATEMQKLILQLNELMPDGNLPVGKALPNRTPAMAEVLRLGKRFHELREEYSQVLRQNADEVFSKQKAFAKDLTDPSRAGIRSLMRESNVEEAARAADPNATHLKDPAHPLDKMLEETIDTLFDGIDTDEAETIANAMTKKQNIRLMFEMIARLSGGRTRKTPISDAIVDETIDTASALRVLAKDVEGGYKLTEADIQPVADKLTRNQLERLVEQHNEGNTNQVIKILNDRAAFFERTTATRRVAPSGADKVKIPLPDSITPGAATRMGQTVEGLTSYLKKHELYLNIETVDGARTFVVRRKNGDAVIQSRLLRDVTAQIEQEVRARRTDALGVLRRQKGDLTGAALGHTGAEVLGGEPLSSNLLTPQQYRKLLNSNSLPVKLTADLTIPMLVGGVFGATFGSIGQSTFTDADYTYKWPIMGAILGSVASGMIAYTATRRLINTELSMFVKQYVPAPESLLPEPQINKIIGKGIRQGGPTKKQFHAFPIERQVEHLRTRVTNIVNSKIDPAERKEDLKRAIARYTPAIIPHTELESTVNHVLGAATAAGFTKNESLDIARGFLANLATPFPSRLRRRRDPDIFSLAADFAATFEGETDIQRVQQMIITTQALSGLDIPVPLGAIKAAQRNSKQTLTPEAQAIKEVMRMADDSSVAQRAAPGVGLDTGRRFFIPSTLRPPLWMLTAADEMHADPARRETGRRIRDLYMGIVDSATAIRTETNEAWVALYRIFDGMSDVNERKAVGRAMEDEAFRAQMMKDNPTIVEKAIELRALLDQYADRMGLPEGERIENYLPWVYSSRTMEELRRSGIVPTDIIVPAGSGIPPHKVMRQMQARTGEIPLGSRIEDPLELGQIYLNGAIRKAHYDNLLASAVGNGELAKVASKEPFVAQGLSKLLMDAMGVPSLQKMAAAHQLRATGLKLEKIAVSMGFHEEEFADQILNRYFLGPGAPNAFSRFVRGAEFYTKIGGNLISMMVNLTQLPINTGTELGLPAIMLGGAHYLGLSLAGYVADTKLGKKALTEGWMAPAGLPNLLLAGHQKRRLAQQAGVFSDNARRILDELDTTQFQEKGLGIIIPVTGGTIAGAATGAIVDSDDRPRGLVRGAGAGALAGAMGKLAVGVTALRRPDLAASLTEVTKPIDPLARTLRRALSFAKDSTIFHFQMAENINRGATAGALEFEMALARAAERKAKIAGVTITPERLRAAEAAGNVALGAASGAAVSAVFNEEPSISSTVQGAAAGAALGIAGRNVSRYDRLLKQEKLVSDQLQRGVPGVMGRLREQGPPSKEEIDRILTRWMLDMTQFRFGIEGRPALLRNNTAGEILGSLQTFTLNQIEFTGSRLKSTVSDAIVPSKWVAGDIDTRFFRHLMLVAGTTAALASVAGFMGDFEQSPFYWLSRVGIGIMPLLNWNEDAQKWTFTSPAQHVLGPFVDDVYNATKTIFNLLTDPIAQAEFDLHIDDLIQDIIPAFRLAPRAADRGKIVLQTAGEVLGATLEALGAEGVAESVESGFSSAGRAVGRTEPTLEKLSRPTETARDY